MMSETERRGFIAGTLIAIAGMFSMSASEYGPVVQGLCFAVGLFGVLCTNAALFTGRMLSVRYVIRREITVRKMLAEWGVVWINNLIGAIMVALFAAGCRYDASAIATAKASMPVAELFARATLCNIMVCLAVDTGRWEKRPSDKLCACILPVACFVACGFEHSVADMFYMALGVLSGSVGIIDMLRVLAVATVGNIFGGTLYAVNAFER